MEKKISKGLEKYGSRPEGRKWNNGVLLTALFRQLEQLFLSFCPRRTLSCPASDLFPRNPKQSRSNGNYDSRNIDIQYHIICSTDPPVG